jgi:hypothetical protein
MKKPSNPFAALGLALRKSVEIPAYRDGWRTSKEVKSETGWGFNATLDNLNAGIKSGIVEKWQGYIWMEGKRQRFKQTKYRFTGKKK